MHCMHIHKCICIYSFVPFVPTISVLNHVRSPQTRWASATGYWASNLRYKGREFAMIHIDLPLKANIYKKNSVLSGSTSLPAIKASFLFSSKQIAADSTFGTPVFPLAHRWPIWPQEGPLCEENMRGGIRLTAAGRIALLGFYIQYLDFDDIYL